MNKWYGKSIYDDFNLGPVKMTRAERINAFNHTFQARGRNRWKVDREEILSTPTPVDTIKCPCGMWLSVLSPVYACCALYICQRCGSWHTVVWHGPKGMEETIEDERIRHELWREENAAREWLTNSEKQDLHRRIDAMRQKAKHPDS